MAEIFENNNTLESQPIKRFNDWQNLEKANANQEIKLGKINEMLDTSFLSPDEISGVYKQMEIASQNGQDPNEVKEKYIQASNFSKYYKIPLDYALNHIEELSQYQLGKHAEYSQSGTKAILNSFKIGWNTTRRADFAQKWAQAEEINDTAEMDFYKKRIEELNAETETLQDYTPRGLGTNLLKGVSNTLAYSGRIMVASILGNLEAPVAGTALGALEGFKLVRSPMYYDMRQQGISKSTANWISNVFGGAESAVESVLGIEQGVARAVTGTAPKVTSKVMAKMFNSGKLSKLAQGAIKWQINATSEGLEEFIQEVIDEVGFNVAYELEGMEAPNKTQDIIKNSLEAFKGGYGVGLILGIGALKVNTKVKLNDGTSLDGARVIRQTAQQANSVEEFTDIVNNEHAGIKPVFDYIVSPDMTENARQATIKEIWDNAHDPELNPVEQAELTEEEKLSDEYVSNFIDSKADSEVSFKGAQLTKEQYLQDQERQYVRDKIAQRLGDNVSEDTIDSGVESMLVASRMLNTPVDELVNNDIVINFDEKGETDTGEKYNGLTFTKDGVYNINVSKTANATTIVHEVGHIVRKMLGEEKLSNFKKRYSSVDGATFISDIQQNDNGKFTLGNQEFDTLKDAIDYKPDTNTNSIRENEEQFAREFEQYCATGIAPDEESKTIFEKLKQFLQNIVAKYRDKLSDEAKADFDRLFNNNITNQTSNAELYQTNDVLDLTEEFNLTSNREITVKDVQNYIDGLIGKAFETSSKPLQIQITKDNVPHIIHSNLNLKGSQKTKHNTALIQIDKIIESAKKNKRDGKVSLIHNTNKNLISHKKNEVKEYVYFDSPIKIADKYFNVELATERIIGQDENLLDLYNVSVKNNSVAAVQTSTLQSNAVGNNINQDKSIVNENSTLYQTNTASEKEYNDIVEQYKNTDKWLKAPNGQPTKLTERQWVQVRTQSFKKWFGDWENNPENASKVVDENGEFNPNNDSILFQLSDTAKQEILKKHENKVQQAVLQGFYVPLNVLQEYAGNNWADEQIRFLENIEDLKPLIERAWNKAQQADYQNNDIEGVDFDKFYQAVADIADSEGIDITSDRAEESFWSRVFDFRKMQEFSNENRTRRFAYQYARTNEDILTLAKRLRNYQSAQKRVRTTKGMDNTNYLSFPDIDQKLFAINDKSTSDEIADVRDMIMSNPKPYREALDKVLLAEERTENQRIMWKAKQGKYGADKNSKSVRRHGRYNEYMQSQDNTIEKMLSYRSIGDRIQEELENADIEEEYNSQQADISNYELNKLNKDLKESQKALEEEKAKADKETAELKNLATYWKNQADASEKEIADLEEQIKNQTGENKELSEKLEKARTKATGFRHELSKKNQELKAVESKLETARNKIQDIKNKIERQQKILNLKRHAKFNYQTMHLDFDKSFEAFNNVLKFGNTQTIPNDLRPYINEQMFENMLSKESIDDWTDSELAQLDEVIKLVRTDAQYFKQEKDLLRKEGLLSESYAYANEVYGIQGALRNGQLSNKALTEDIKENQKAYDKLHKYNVLLKANNEVRNAFIKPQRLARMIDADREGVAYDRFVRKAFWCQQNEDRNVTERMQAFKDKCKELKITPKYLNEVIAEYEINSTGVIDKLTREECIGVYIYNQNRGTQEKLAHVSGNGFGMDGQQIADVISKLSDKDKEFGDFLIDQLGNDTIYNRIKKVYEEVYNMRMGRQNAYFTSAAEDKEEDIKPIFYGATAEFKKYIDKGFTKQRVQGAIYALDLDVVNTFVNQVKRQEHFIAYAQWVKDSQYLLSNKLGGFGSIVAQKYGNNVRKELTNYVNDIVGSTKRIEKLEQLANIAITNSSIAVLAGNLMTTLKQIPSITTSLRGDIDFSKFLSVSSRLVTDRKATLEFIRSKTTDIDNRVIDEEVKRFNEYKTMNNVQNSVKKFSDSLMVLTREVDKAICATLWLSCYETNIANGMSEQEATFKASQLINETQPTSGNTNLSKAQRSKNPFVRMAILFTNQVVNVQNQIYFDLPYFAKTHQTRKFIGTLANVVLSATCFTLLSGFFFKDDDDKEEALKKEILAQVFTYCVPFFGPVVVAGMRGFDQDNAITTIPKNAGEVLGNIVKNPESTNYQKNISSKAWDLFEESLNIYTGAPTTFLQRIYNSIKNVNPFYLFGTGIGKDTDDLFE